MFLKKIYEKKSDRTFLNIVRSRRVNGKNIHETVQSVGYLDELTALYNDPVAHFKEIARNMTIAEKEAQASITLKFTVADTLTSGQPNRKNIGYFPLSKLYTELQISKFMTNRQRNLNISYNLDSIFRLLVFSRILFPDSKKKTYENRERFFERFHFSLDDVYRSLSLFHRYADDLKAFMHKQVCQRYDRKTDLVFYDVTNYYFEIEQPDELRKRGVSKEHRPNPIVQMGLLMDQKGLPVTYELFSGNTNDCETLMPVLHKVRQDFDIGRFIVVADRGLNTSNNTAMALAKGDVYIYGQSILKASEAMKAYCLKEDGYNFYKDSESGFKIKSRIMPRTIRLENAAGKMIEVAVDEKQIFLYSEKYARRTRAKRQEALEKAVQLIASPSKYLSAAQQGVKKYIQGLQVDSETGEILNTQQALFLDEEKIAQEAQYDGYYAVVTSELDMPDTKVMDHYKGLWQIEESFCLTKSDLEARPVFVSTQDHINAHFLTCFVALLLLRLVQLKTDHKYPAGQLLDAMRNANGTLLDNGYYVFDYYNECLKHLGHCFNLDFSKKFLNKSVIQTMKK